MLQTLYVLPNTVALAKNATSRVSGGGANWSGAPQLEGLMEDMHGKVSTGILDVSSAENASPKLESESRLFWLERRLGANVFGCIIGSRLCITSVYLRLWEIHRHV
jgi:hypothetical protein